MRIMSNPAQLLIRGNPGKRRRGRKTTTKGTTMATRRRRRKSPSSIAKRRAKRATRKASRKGKMPAGLAAWHAKQRGGKIARKARRSRRGKKSSAKRSRRRSRARRRKFSHALAVPRRARKARRSRKSRGRGRRRAKARSRRRVRSNAGEISLVGAFTGLPGGLRDVFKGGVLGIASAVGGAGAAVVGGAFVSRLTNGLLFRFAPGLASNPMAARGIGALNFLLPGYAVAKWAPGISGRVRRGILTGAAVAAIIEAFKPGAVRDTLASIPVVGGIFGPSLSGLADSMGDYLAFGMSGASARDAAAALPYDDSAPGMADYMMSMRTDADRTMRADGGMGDYAMFGDG